MPKMLNCRYCSKEFKSYYNRKYCSLTCIRASKADKKPPPTEYDKVCKTCGSSFTTTRHNAENCSIYCSIVARKIAANRRKGKEE